MLFPSPGRATLARALAALSASLLLQAIPGQALAISIPGTPDTTFGASGVATVPATTSRDLPYSATGKFASFVTGESYRGSARHLFLAKFRSDGTFDPTFAAAGPTPGRTLLRLDGPAEGRMVREQPDGKLVVVGTQYLVLTNEIVVARFNADGTLDTGFGVGGVFRRQASSISYGSAVEIQADGKIVVAGETYDGANGYTDIVVLRLNANGSPDASFGISGSVRLDFRQGFDAARAITVIAGGKILVAGTSANAPGGRHGFSIARLAANGSIDATFGPANQGGLVLIDVGGPGDLGDMSVAGNSIWLGGTASNRDTSVSMAVVKLSADGLLDATFNSTGIAMTPSGGASWGFAVVPDATGVFVGGLSGSNFSIARFDASGNADAAFGRNGIMVDAEPSFGGVKALYIQADGMIVAIGAMPEEPANYRQDIGRIRYTGRGGRDFTYGTGGKVLANLFDLSWDMRAVSMEQDGRIVLAGTLYDGHDADFGVLRLLANGSPDYSFGSLGMQTVAFPGGIDYAYAMLKQPDGMRVIAGSSERNGTRGFALARITADLTPDYFGFGTDGRVTHSMGIGYAEILALAQAPDGKIVAAGYVVESANDYDFAIARYTTSGVLDPSFGGGVQLTSFGSFGTGKDVANAVAVQPDGKIVAAGYTRIGNLFDFAVARYNLNGSLDATFGTGGKVVIPVGASNDIARSLAILPNGKILVAGESFNSATSNDMAVVRLNANGSIDGTFANAGVALVDFAGGADSAFAIAVQENGKIVLAGSAFADGPAGTQRAFALARLTPTGALDTAFGSGFANNGRAATDITGLPDTAYAVALQRDGKIVSVGTAGAQWAVTRHLGDPRAIATDLNGDGRSDMLYRNGVDGRVQRMLMNGFAITSNAQAYVESDLAWHIVADGDFNGDSITDLLWRHDDGRIYVMPFNAAGMPMPGAVIYTEQNIAWKIAATTDINGDGKADIVWWNSNTGQVYVMLVNGFTLGAQGLMYIEPDLNWRIVATGDFSGSGKSNQLLWRHAADGRVYLMTVSVVGSTFGQTGQAIYTEANLAWKIVGAADFNGDTRTDILWRKDDTGEVYLMLMNGPVIENPGYIYAEPNLAWKIVAQGDYNGDGKADILYRNESTGEVFMILMNGLAIANRQMVYAEPNLAWKILGPNQYNP